MASGQFDDAREYRDAPRTTGYTHASGDCKAPLSSRLLHAEWLTLSEVAMRTDNRQPAAEHSPFAMTEDELDLLALWRQQPFDVRKHLIGLMAQYARLEHHYKTMD